MNDIFERIAAEALREKNYNKRSMIDGIALLPPVLLHLSDFGNILFRFARFLTILPLALVGILQNETFIFLKKSVIWLSKR